MKPATSFTIIQGVAICCLTWRATPYGPRLECHHVDALGGAIGHFRSLACFEVQPVEPARQIDERVHIEANHARQRTRGAGETLEADVDTRVPPRHVLLDDVGEHAVAGRQLEAPNDLFEQLFETDDGSRDRRRQG
jgi:hypothetical protein